MRAESLQSCLTPLDTMDCSPPGSSVHGILQARILEWVAMPSSRRSSPHLLHFLHRQEGSLPLVQPGTPYYTVCIKQSEEQFMLLLKQALKKISSLTAAVTVTNNDITTLASVCHLTVALRKPQFLSLKIQGNLKTRQLSSVWQWLAAFQHLEKVCVNPKAYGTGLR